MRRFHPALLPLVVLAVAATVAAALTVTTGGAAASGASTRLVGRWARLTTCQGFVDALRKAGLGAVAPAIVAGNGLVPGTPEQLAQKKDLCKGAVPRVHSHFFVAGGEFGSLDWKGQRVDDGQYRIINDQTVRIGDGTFRYRISNGNRLRLNPVISAAARRQALVRPLKFSVAGWMVAVAYAGHTWKRVPCAGWC